MTHILDPLLTYLSYPLPAIPRQEDMRTGPHKRYPGKYNPSDITEVRQWSIFKYRVIVDLASTHTFGPRIRHPGFDMRPPQPIGNVADFKIRFSDLVSHRLCQALRSSFAALSLSNHPALADVTVKELTFYTQPQLPKPTGIRADFGLARVGQRISDRRNRCPGVATVSSQWRCSWLESPQESKRREFYHVLAQVNYHMRQNSTRYGFVTTDMEFVPVLKVDDNGRLQIGEPIPWTASNIRSPGNPGYNPERPREQNLRGVVTPMLALWYLGVLAAVDEEHFLPGPRDHRRDT